MRLGSRNSRQEDRRTVELLRRLPPHILQAIWHQNYQPENMDGEKKMLSPRGSITESHNYQSRLELELCLSD